MEQINGAWSSFPVKLVEPNEKTLLLLLTKIVVGFFDLLKKLFKKDNSIHPLSMFLQ